MFLRINKTAPAAGTFKLGLRPKPQSICMRDLFKRDGISHPSNHARSSALPPVPPLDFSKNRRDFILTVVLAFINVSQKCVFEHVSKKRTF